MTASVPTAAVSSDASGWSGGLDRGGLIRRVWWANPLVPRLWRLVRPLEAQPWHPNFPPHRP